MYQLIGLVGKIGTEDQIAHYSKTGQLTHLAMDARNLAARWGNLMQIRMYRFDGTAVLLQPARRVRLP